MSPCQKSVQDPAAINNEASDAEQCGVTGLIIARQRQLVFGADKSGGALIAGTLASPIQPESAHSQAGRPSSICGNALFPNMVSALTQSDVLIMP